MKNIVIGLMFASSISAMANQRECTDQEMGSPIYKTNAPANFEYWGPYGQADLWIYGDAASEMYSSLSVEKISNGRFDKFNTFMKMGVGYTCYEFALDDQCSNYSCVVYIRSKDKGVMGN